MALIATQPAETAEKRVRVMYEPFVDRLKMVPRPLQLMSASPDLLSGYLVTMSVFLDHPTLSPSLLTHIRLQVSLNTEFPYCVDLNAQFLQTMDDLTPEELAALRADPASADLSEGERALLLFVLKSVTQPEDVDDSDMAGVRVHGWSDQEIFEATYHGAAMVSIGILFNAFKMHED